MLYTTLGNPIVHAPPFFYIECSRSPNLNLPDFFEESRTFLKLINWWLPQTSYDFSISGRVFSRKALGTISLYLSTAARYAPTIRWRLSWEAGTNRTLLAGKVYGSHTLRNRK
jgi:hypothetical protein